MQLGLEAGKHTFKHGDGLAVEQDRGKSGVTLE